MQDLADEPIGELSGGQQQRVFLARALVASPQVVLLDEPMTGVDQGAQESLMNLLEQLKARLGLTMVMVSHNLRSIIASCDQVACLNRTLHYHDRPAAISHDDALARVPVRLRRPAGTAMTTARSGSTFSAGHPAPGVAVTSGVPKDLANEELTWTWRSTCT